MQLQYLIFDATDDESGACSFDALASALPARLPALLDELGAVLRWAHRSFGPATTGDDAGEWHYLLGASTDEGVELEIAYDTRDALVRAAAATGRVTVSFTLAGSAAFAHAFRSAFPDGS